jgi:hypothetical protein
MKKDTTAKRNPADSAMQQLRSTNFFLSLRGDMRRLGLAGLEELIGLGIYFIAVSRSQEYPLRGQIREQTEGTAAHMVRNEAKFLLPGDVVKVTPTGEKGWARFSAAPDRKLVFIPTWQTDAEPGAVRLDVGGDQLARWTPVRADGRVVEQVIEVPGRFACISVERPDPWVPKVRWLTMVQPDRQQVAEETSIFPDPETDFEVWHEVDRLLQERARLPVVLPEWEQAVLELAFEKGGRALQHLPTLLQMWRTMSLIQSFQSELDSEASSIMATFENLASAMLLGRKAFKEASWFPSCQKIYDKLARPGERTSVINPVTGKAVQYQRRQKKAPVHYAELPEWLDGEAD